ncbi:hypothetical protein BJV82DRAFT_607427 [Fennellomyces sp. T-0311]|nr:hypothetical protein BJV82DRAFT_607427 [Fennellomyces sp. T-0311]
MGHDIFTVCALWLRFSFPRCHAGCSWFAFFRWCSSRDGTMKLYALVLCFQVSHWIVFH